MAFRENIEAILKVRDLARFKGGMKEAVKSIKNFETEAEQAAASLELLKSIEKSLGRQTDILAAQSEMLSKALNDVGDEAVSAAAKNEILNKSLKRGGGILPTTIKRWSFWKDRLSLTRSEIMTTAITIGTYLAPALIAVGNSAVAAALGGGAVAAGGLSSLILGFGSLMIVGKQMVGQVQKIQKAQDAYNLAVVQFGAGSKEAARQAAHLYAVIQTQGGQPMRDAQQALEKFKKTFQGATGGARVNLAEIMTAGLGQLTGIMPQIGQEINMMSLALKKALKESFKHLAGPEMMSTFKTLSQLFQDAIGPGVRGVTNLFIVFGRILRASAPWALRTAKAFERITFSWRRGTHDGLAVQRIIDNLVLHTRSWIALGAQVLRTFKILFVDTKERGRGLVDEMTILVTRFNDWLQAVSDSGKIAALFDKYIRSLHDLAWAVQNPVDAIRKWLPVLMDAVATTVGENGPRAAALFLDAFFHAGAWAQFFTIAFLMKRFGIFKLLGAAVARPFIDAFMKVVLARFGVMLGIEALASGSMGTAAAAAGAALGTVFWGAFALGAAALLGIALAKILDKFSRSRIYKNFLRIIGAPTAGGGPAPGPEKITASALQGTGQAPNTPITHNVGPVELKPRQAPGAGIHHNLPPAFRGAPNLRRKAAGGLIPSGTLALVGEAGPELAMSTVGGTHISPLTGSGTNTGSGMMPMAIPPISVSDFVPPISVSVQIERREIARAVADYEQYRRARRGET